MVKLIQEDYVFLIGRDRVQSLKKIIKKISKKPGAEDLKKVWQLELSYPLQAVITNDP